MADGTRLLAAIVIVLAYAAFCAWFLRPRRDKAPAGSDDDGATLIAYASQTGFAEQLATQTANSLRSVGMPVRLASTQQLDTQSLSRTQQALFIVSTTGEGDAPDPAATFVSNVLDRSAALPDLRYGVLALGDRKYSNFCAFGHRLDHWLRHQGATALFDVVEVDNGDEGALRNWQHQLSVLSASPDLPDWETPRYDRWRLSERRLMNPGSAGDPCFHLILTPDADVSVTWRAGDIAEIDPRNSTWDATLQPLPHREYSIASIPANGAVHLLVRQMRRPDGEPGIGSGWLTQQLAVGGEVALRIRANSNFHAPADVRPLILIGNGTGIAGLRALLLERIAAGNFDNWLLFGERSAASDYFFREDIDAWLGRQQLKRLDLMFSRDQAERVYVQHRLLEREAEIRDWIANGAAVYVCGSLQGMAPGVDAALTHILGAEAMEQLARSGGYRRDVY